VVLRLCGVPAGVCGSAGVVRRRECGAGVVVSKKERVLVGGGWWSVLA
jgi:hypothetical protein